MNPCPQCGATTRPDAPWCTLCYHSLRPVPAATPSPEPLAVAVASAAEPYQHDARWPCLRCGTDNGLAEPCCGTCGAAFLADVAEGGLSLRLPVVGELTGLSKAASYSLAVGFAVVLALLVAAVALVL